MNEQQRQQVQMHRDFFDQCRSAIDGGFYMEAMLMEYAAVEARMEVLLGVLDLPCNKFLDDKARKNVQLSHRVHCAHVIRKQSSMFDKSKLEPNFFDKLSRWTKKRDEYIHGLYKNELKYKGRMLGAEKMAQEGLELCRLLYNEVNRIKRLKREHPDKFDRDIRCSSHNCQLKQLHTENE